MAHQTFLIGLVLVPALLLIALVWWRFQGKGGKAGSSRPHADLYRFQPLRKHYYDISDFMDPLPAAEPSEGEGIQNILKELIEGTDYGTPYGTGEASWEEYPPPDLEKEETTPTTDQTEAGENPIPETGSPQPPPPPPTDTASGSPEASDEGDDTIAPSLFHNAVTAPADTANDVRNRQALTEHRARKGAALRAKLTNQREALGDMFLGKPAAAHPEDTIT
jgi:hypothetical protein